MSVGILKAAKGKQQLEYQISINHHKQYTIYFTCFHSSNFPLIAHHRAATLTRLVLYIVSYIDAMPPKAAANTCTVRWTTIASAATDKTNVRGDRTTRWRCGDVALYHVACIQRLAECEGALCYHTHHLWFCCRQRSHHHHPQPYYVHFPHP